MIIARRMVHAVVVYLCLSVSLSVTLRYCIKTTKRSITQIMPHDSPGTEVMTKFERDHRPPLSTENAL